MNLENVTIECILPALDIAYFEGQLNHEIESDQPVFGGSGFIIYGVGDNWECFSIKIKEQKILKKSS